MHFSDLGGNSGCKILLVEDNNFMFVRKISRDINYNSRLKIQAEKQKNFISNFASAPKIYNTGYTDEGLFYFDMEYIRGITLAEYMKIIHVSSIHDMVEDIAGSILNFERKEAPAMNTEAFTEKIASLRETLEKTNNPTAERALDILSSHKWNNFCISPCHGDLTLENIIMKNGKLYLIDFLDSFYDCWLMDAATLMQDALTMWSYRKSGQDINTIIRLVIFRDILVDIIAEKAGALYITEIYYALLLKLVRIYPYAKDNITLRFLDIKTEAIINKLS